MLMKANDLSSKEFRDLISNQEITVYEDIQGTKIWCNYSNNKWEIRPKSITQNPINIIDLATQKLYKYVYGYLLSLPDNVTRLLNQSLYFCFEYFPDEQPANIKYEKLPTNRLILTCICKNGRTYSYNLKELKVYSDLLGVELLPVIYTGRLSNKQLTDICNFLSTSETDLEFLNNETNFAKYFYNLLNPNINNSYLTSSFQENLEKIIIRFEKDFKCITMEILNPLYTKCNSKIDSNYSDVYSVLIFNFLEFLYTIDINDLKISGRNREIIYINVISQLYNMYMALYEKDINNMDFTIPTFFNSDKFKINQILIDNIDTVKYINNSSKNEYVLKIILNTFKTKQQKKIGIFTDLTLKYLNDIIRKIHVRIEELFNYNNSFPTYAIKQDMSKYPNIKWEEDHKGYVKTKQGKLFDETDINNKKKKI